MKLMRSMSGEEGSARNMRRSMRRSAINVRSIGGMRSMRGNGDEMRQCIATLWLWVGIWPIVMIHSQS